MRRPSPPGPQYAHWRESLLARIEKRRGPPVYEDAPQCGLWRSRDTNGDWTPVRIWLDQVIDDETGELLQDERISVQHGDTIAATRNSEELIWSSCARHPITKAEYEYYAELTRQRDAKRLFSRPNLNANSQ